MALSLISEGATSSTNDLNQIVNLLNGTTTNTQLTVNGPIGAQVSGTSAPMRYVGGIPAPTDNTLYDTLIFNGAYAPNPFNTFLAPIQVPLTYGSSSTATQGTPTSSTNGAYYQAADLAWTPGGPMAIGATAPTSRPWVIPGGAIPGVYTAGQGGPITIGTGGYVCRAHQSAAVSVTGSTLTVGTDTVDYDPRGMYRPSVYGIGGAIQLPFPGLWGILGAIHGAANSMTNQWGINVQSGSGIGGQVAQIAMTALNTPNDASHPYTGAVAFAVVPLGPGYWGPAYYPGASVQLSFVVAGGAPVTSYSLDVSGPDRTFIAAWLMG